MRKYKRVYVSPETHKRVKTIAAQKGCSIAEAIAKALGNNATEAEKKVNNYGFFK